MTDQTKINPISKGKKKVILANATIGHGRDTAILQVDLDREFQHDNYSTDQSHLINSQWVPFFTPDYSFLKGLMALVNNSTTLRNVLNQKTTISMGDGFIPYQSDTIPILQTFRKFIKKLFETNDDLQKLNDFLGNVNLHNETLEDVIRKVFFDWWAFGNAIVEMVETTRDGKAIVMLYHIPLHKTAIKKTDESNIIKAIGINDNWSTITAENITEIPLYPEWSKGKSKRTAIHIKNYSPGFFYWGIPSNIAARFYAELEYRIPKYNIAKFKNGFVPSSILQYFGQMTPDEAQSLVNKTVESFTDTGQNAKMLVQVLSDEKYKMNVEILEDKNEGNYMELERMCSQGIVTGSEWTMSLSGFSTGGQLGTNQQMRDELEFCTNTTIKPARRRVLQSIINPFIKENQRFGACPKGIMLQIASMNPISLASSIDANMLLLMNEKREILGYDALDEKAMNLITNEMNKNGNDNNANKG